MFEVLHPGLYTSVQDLGRRGWRQLGFASSGAMDPLAAQAANALLNQDGNLPVLECTLIGPSLKFHCDSAIAVSGATMSIEINGKPQQPGKSLAVKAGQRVKLGRAAHGCRSYLAIKGGMQVKSVLGSVSYQSKLGLGQRLHAGDQIAINAYQRHVPNCHSWVGMVWPLTPVLSCFAGPDVEMLDGGLLALCRKPWQVSPQSNRLGLRINGRQLDHQPLAQKPSEPVLPGTVQLPANGLPLILGPDCQSVGGYPKIAQISRSSLTTLGQMRPNQGFWFEAITLEQAQHRLSRQYRHLRRLRLSTEQHWQHD